MDIKSDFAGRLVLALDAKGVRPIDAERKRYLSKLLNLSERQIGYYLKGQKMPTLDGAIDLALKLGVSAEWLMSGRGLMRPLSPEEAAHINQVRDLPEEDRERVYRISRHISPGRLPPPTLMLEHQ
jgi:transcriptional regulator with XRE-family HTH domain